MAGAVKVRDLIQELKSKGATVLRTHGSHQVWHVPGSGNVTLVVNHPNAEASRAVVLEVRKALGQKRGGGSK